MSLGTHTKCDLSGDKASLDMETLRVQIERRFYSLVKQIEKKTSEVCICSLTEEQKKEVVFTMTVCGADHLLQLTQNLAETAELLHTLNNLNGRELVTIHTEEESR